VRFAIRHDVDVPPAQVMAAYGSPAFYEGRRSRDGIDVLGVVGHEDRGDVVVLEVRFAFTGPLSAAVRAVVDPQKMSWVTRTELRPAEGRSTWVVLPDHYADRLSAEGTYRFEPDGGAGTAVEVEGELTIRVPVVGRTVERTIVSGLRAYLEDEVASVADLA
jgi:Protein of unknown function (DUF2505)